MAVRDAHSRLGRYMVELSPRSNGYDDLHQLTARSHAACAELARDNVEVRLLRSLFLPEDGTVVMLFDAASAPAVDEVGRIAALPITRVSVLLATHEVATPSG